MIYPFVPYHPEGLGHAYNHACKIVPRSDDIVVLMDADVFLFGKWGHEIERCMAMHTNFQVFTCMATRTYRSNVTQVPEGEIRSCPDMVRLQRYAEATMKERTGLVMPVNQNLSGFLMAFRREVWDRVPFPEKGTTGHPILGIDTAWSIALRKEGFRCCAMRGLVAVHYYRLGQGEKSKTHLS